MRKGIGLRGEWEMAKLTMETINEKMEMGLELTQKDMDFISYALTQPTNKSDSTEPIVENSAEYQACLNDAYKTLHGEFYPQLDNLQVETIESVVETMKDEMCVLTENIKWAESRHRKVPVVLQRKYDKFMNKWENKIVIQ
mgnify:FL=1